MMAAKKTSTRAERARQYVELSALDFVLGNLMSNVADADRRLPELHWEEVHVDGDAHSIDELFGEFFPASDELDKGIETVEQLLIRAEQEALVARIFALLASDESREACIDESARFAAMAQENAARAREMLAAEGGA
jgi:hypothetical protein